MVVYDCMIYHVRLCMFVLQVCREILGSRLTGITNIRAVYDFKSFLQGVRPRSADKDIQSQYSLQFKVTEDASAIVVRSKPWSPV